MTSSTPHRVTNNSNDIPPCTDAGRIDMNIHTYTRTLPCSMPNSVLWKFIAWSAVARADEICSSIFRRVPKAGMSMGVQVFWRDDRRRYMQICFLFIFCMISRQYSTTQPDGSYSHPYNGTNINLDGFAVLGLLNFNASDAYLSVLHHHKITRRSKYFRLESCGHGTLRVWTLLQGRALGNQVLPACGHDYNSRFVFCKK